MGSREQKASKVVHEKSVTLRANRIRKVLDYTNVENPLYVGETRQSSCEEQVIQLRPAMNHNRNMGDKDEGLVKHMRNLPGFLLREEKGENIQGKALNFGVLDWGRLENWKSNEKRIPPRYNMKTTSFTNNSTNVETRSTKFSRNRKKILPPWKDQQASNGSPLSGERLPPGVRWPRGNPIKLQCAESSPGRMLDGTSRSNDIRKGKMTSEKETPLDLRKMGSRYSPNFTRSPHASPMKMPSDDPCPSGSHNAVPSSVDFTETNSSHDCWLSSDSNSFSPGEFHPLSSFSDVPHSSPFPLPLSAEENKLKIQNFSIDKAFKESNVDTDENTSLKGRHPSPNRRFSFSLQKMTRSFSFKESSTLPQLSSKYTSVKSGPVKFENTTNPSRSSPLRRLLDPLLKLKGAQISEKIQKTKLDIQRSTGVSLINQNELLQIKKHRQRQSNVQALIQLTLKNGIPFFKLVVENSSDILAAAIKKLPSGKDDSSLIYSFYSVHENKKKSGSWINQSSKEKSCGFGYHIVGQMKISSSYHAEFSGQEKDLYVVRESVLYADQESVDGILDGEVAAIIVKNPSDRMCGDIGGSKNMVVVIPDGVHSLPNGGMFSPLIERWRSGGVCDCGGWDIGCRFHILSNQNEVFKTPTSSVSNRLDLCCQGWGKRKSSYSLVALEDGVYSLEYDTSMSLLQAFSICVAVVSSQKLTHIFQVNYVPLTRSKRTPLNLKPDKIVPGKYDWKPPASPVGRV